MVAPVEHHPRRPRRERAPVLRDASAVQIFVFENEVFVGSEVFGLEDGVVIGRHPVCDLRLDADTVSREHARLWVEDGVVLVRDLRSGNGLFIDRRRVEGPSELGPRDPLQIGPYTLRARALAARPAVPRDLAEAEADTRLEALLGAENTDGTRELPIDLADATPHLRLIEAAISRQSSEATAAAIPEPSTPTPEEPGADARLVRRVRDLDALLASLDGRRPSVVPWRAPSEPAAAPPFDTDAFRRDLASPAAVDGVLSPVPAPASVRETPAEPRRDALLFEPPILDPGEEDTEAELEDAPLASAARSLEPSPDDEPTEAAPERARTPSERALEPLSLELVPQRPAFDDPTATAADTRPGTPAALGATPSAPVEARLVTPSDLGVSVSPVFEPRTASPAPGRAFDAVEVVASRAGEILDIAVLRAGEQQYVLGHPTPQGHLAPFADHEGLRLVRLHPDASADLVFPLDVRGTLERGSEQVRLQDLTEGRKYSCLRLEVGDRAEVRLGDAEDEVSYRISFRTRPATLFGRAGRAHPRG